MSIRKIISGGQTGVDQAALKVALALHLDCGGWCPPGRVCEDGIIPAQYPLKETPLERSPNAPDIPRSQRTEFNVRDADGTLILTPDAIQLDKGTQWTMRCAEMLGKPWLKVDPFDRVDSIRKIEIWAAENRIGILNVAGPSEATWPGIGESAYSLLWTYLT